MNRPRFVETSSAKTLAVFIDADNLNDPTALDRILIDLRSVADRVLIRKAYGRPESLKGIEAVLWKHGVRPVANLIVDKVTTDSALVIDAVESVCTSDIDTVAICSGDADFVPLALWLREKGCTVLCFSLTGKIFANPESFYDDVILIDVVDGIPSDVEKPITPRIPLQATTVKSSTKQITGKSEVLNTTVKTDATSQISHPKNNTTKPSLKDILTALPELKNNESLHISVATKKLREANLLGKNASSPALFRNYAGQFELTPNKQPNAVKYRG
ncbi:MAG TPA: NYN domain-containing protein [Burkholderiaceae bacterium]|nr:NYN domain-containing protein [Burkholderiaceae bacterium]HRH06655.1 NYN domain-containing protein [Burkholderiaceae bacterium]